MIFSHDFYSIYMLLDKISRYLLAMYALQHGS